MFHFPSFPPLTLCVQVRVTGHDSSWVSPFGHPRITARLPTPRGLSQAPTSFIGSWCQGIHRLPLVACLNIVKTTQLQRPTTTPQSGMMAHLLILHIHITQTKYQSTDRACVMLASTIQISNNKPTNPSDQAQLDLQRRRPEQPDTHPKVHGPIPQDPTVCLDPPPTSTNTSVPRLQASSTEDVEPTRFKPFIDDSTSETPPCATEHSPVVGMCAP
jgi:hypothetical protein